MSSADEGGTKIQKRPPMGSPPPPSQQMPMQQRPSIPPPGLDDSYQQMLMQQQMQIQQQVAAQQQVPIEPMAIKSKSNFKSKFSSSMKFSDFKLSIFVVLIFFLLNSKIVWKNIIRLPMMGTTDPSIIALIVNSILAGIAFYIISHFI